MTIAEPGPFVLNVNDDAAARYLIGRILRGAGFDVVDAATGTEALALARKQPALVVLDVKLPDLSGLEVCRRLKADPETAGIPVLQTSATFTSSDRRVAGLESGADGYVTQPIEPAELVATVHSLLRTQRAEESVRAAARQWRRTFEALAEPVALLDVEGRVVRCNAAFLDLTGLDEAALADQDYTALLEILAPDTRLPSLARVASDRARDTAEVRIADRVLRLALDPIVNEEGEIGGFVLVGTDLTDVKRLEELHRQRAAELAEADRRKDEFLAMLAHELRNPLHAIAAAMSLQERLRPGDERHGKLRATVNRQTRHLARLVDDLLEVSRITRGRIELKSEPVDLVPLMQEAARACHPFLEARRQRFLTSAPARPVVVDGDPLRLEQAFLNLLHNASKFTEPGGRIWLVLETDASGPGTAVVRVKDEGVGFDPAWAESIFELFVQVDQTLARSRGGLGVGLTITRKLVELHGGTVRAFSEGPGRGTEFVVRLPLAAAAQAPVRDTAPPPPEKKARRVLLVEDDADSAELLREFFEAEGHTVTVARDGASGLEAALTQQHEVAFVDIGLPGIDGYQVARNVRSVAALDGLVLVALTGYGRPEDRARALEAGFDLHLVKPFAPEEVGRVLSGAIRRRPKAGAA